jgi:hypothetical protein
MQQGPLSTGPLSTMTAQKTRKPRGVFWGRSSNEAVAPPEHEGRVPTDAFGQAKPP